MTGKLLTPPNFGPLTDSVIFLAGPIQGAPDWQTDAIKLIHNYDSSINIASPRREEGSYKGKFTDKMYTKQVDWENRYLNMAGNDGVVLFWLAKEKDHICERAYAQTSRFELGEWYNRSLFDNRVNLVVGLEEGFSNARYIRKRISGSIPIHGSLEETCEQAVKLYQNKTNVVYNVTL